MDRPLDELWSSTDDCEAELTSSTSCGACGHTCGACGSAACVDGTCSATILTTRPRELTLLAAEPLTKDH